MQSTLTMRTTSLLAAATLMGLAVLAALSISYTIELATDPDRPIEVSVITPPPLAQPPLRAAPRPPAAPSELEEPRLAPAEPAESSIAESNYDEPGPVTILRPHWLEVPRDLARYYPRRAATREIQGIVVLDCLVTITGRLACAVMSETPANWGFADAALRIAADHRMAPATRDGAPVEGRYRMRVPFELD